MRTLILRREKDEWGESFGFAANGVPFFAKGADWIPADSIYTRASAKDYRLYIPKTPSEWASRMELLVCIGTSANARTGAPQRLT